VNKTLLLVIVFVIGYLVGVKWPSAAQSVGL
jgi:hypothetical protein